MPVVAERIMGRNEVGEIGIETRDGKAKTQFVFYLIVERCVFCRFRLPHTMGAGKQHGYKDQ